MLDGPAVDALSTRALQYVKIGMDEEKLKVKVNQK
jgi:hypothetical protein